MRALAMIDIDLKGWPKGDAYHERIEQAGLRALKGNRELFVKLTWYSDVLAELEAGSGESEELFDDSVSPQVLRTAPRVVSAWRSEDLVSFGFDGGLSSHSLDFSVHSCPRQRVFLVLATDALASGISWVCGGGVWPPRAGEKWRAPEGSPGICFA